MKFFINLVSNLFFIFSLFFTGQVLGAGEICGTLTQSLPSSTSLLSYSVCAANGVEVVSESNDYVYEYLKNLGLITNSCKEIKKCPSDAPYCEPDPQKVSYIGFGNNYPNKKRGKCKDGTKFKWTGGSLVPLSFSTHTVTYTCICCPDGNSSNGEGEERQDRSAKCIPGCPCKKLVTLNKFIAIPQKEGILLKWNTESEIDSQGFRIWQAIPDLNNYCGCSNDINDYKKIHVLDKDGKPVLIPAKGNEISGFEYSYLDKSAKPGIAYCYALEDIDSKGESKFYFEYITFVHLTP